jgi:hypothetical protein
MRTITKSLSTQIGSFAIEAAFVILAITCMGLAFMYHASDLIGESGVCDNSVNSSGASGGVTEIDSLSVRVIDAEGLIGLLNVAWCKMEVILEDGSNKSLKWEFRDVFTSPGGQGSGQGGGHHGGGGFGGFGGFGGGA